MIGARARRAYFETMKGLSVLISGGGIAGLALARRLLNDGFFPTLIESAPGLQTQGHMIDFWGSSYSIVEKLGLLPEIVSTAYHIDELRLVDRHGRRIGGFDSDVFRALSDQHYTSMPRAELCALLCRGIESKCEIEFANRITQLEPDASGVTVHFERGPTRRFDLVVGADGLHSGVRRLAFGPDARFEYFLGYTFAAFELAQFRPREENTFVAYAEAGRELACFALRDQRTMVFVVIADDDAANLELAQIAAQKAYLRERLSGMRWEAPQILDELSECRELYFDRVSQIRMDRWSKGRVTLVGDAACAPSALAGQGLALALTGSYVLAGELARAMSLAAGLAAYESRLYSTVADIQRETESHAASLAPRTWARVALRTQLSKLFWMPLITKLSRSSSLLESLDLPDYAYAHWPSAEGAMRESPAG
jgi:2-polyprenyl-6-methoxyphenol hydroxylase-like FAD-dependent oxidoreductase